MHETRSTRFDIRLPWKELWPAVLLPCLCLGMAMSVLFLYAFDATRSAMRESIANDMRAIAKLKAGQIEHWLAERRDDAQLIATAQFNRDLHDWLAGNRRDDTIRQRLIEQLSIPDPALEPRTFALRAVDGRLLLATDARPDTAEAQRQAREAARLGRTTLEPMHFTSAKTSSDRPRPVIEMGYFTPLRLSEGAPVQAVLHSRMSPEHVLYPLLQSWPGVSASAETMILQRESDRIVYLNDLRHLPESALRTRRPLAGESLIAKRVITEGEGFFEERDYRGVPSLAYGMPIAETPWFLIAKIDRSEAFHQIDTIASIVSALCGMLLLACTAWLLARKHKEMRLTTLLSECEDLYQQAPCGYHSLDRDGVFLRVNETQLKMLGYAREELIGKMNLRRLLTEASLRKFQEHMPRVVALEEIRDVEYEMVRKDGSIMPVLVSASAFRDRNGEFLMTRTMVYDITERKVMEDQLRRSEERFRTLFRSIRDQVFVRESLPDGGPGRIVELNDVASERLGYTREELLALGPLDLYPHAYTDERRDDIYRSLDEGGNVVFEQVQRAKDGRLIPVEISANRLVLQGQSLYIALVRDISERKRHEEELRLMRRAIESSAHGLMILKLAAESLPYITYVNPAFEHITGYPPDEALGRTPEFLYDQDRDQPCIDELRAALEESRECGVTIRFFRKNGVPLWSELLASPVRDQSGRTTHYVAIISDVTSRMAIEAELVASRELLRKLASHDDAVREAERKHMARELHDELGQMLTALKMKISLLQMRFDAVSGLVDMTEEMRMLVENTIGVVRDAVSNLRPAALDLGIVGALEWLADDFTRHTGIPCRYEGERDEPLLGDKLATVVFRIAQESLTNVARHARAGKVGIRLACDHDILRLSVIDDGCGFDEHEVARSRRNFGLLGMQERVSMLAGSFRIQTRSGHGTHIVIELPLTGQTRP